MTTFDASASHCRVAAYNVLSSNGTRYCIETSFSEAAKVVERLDRLPGEHPRCGPCCLRLNG